MHTGFSNSFWFLPERKQRGLSDYEGSLPPPFRFISRTPRLCPSLLELCRLSN